MFTETDVIFKITTAAVISWVSWLLQTSPRYLYVTEQQNHVWISAISAITKILILGFGSNKDSPNYFILR